MSEEKIKIVPINLDKPSRNGRIYDPEIMRQAIQEYTDKHQNELVELYNSRKEELKNINYSIRRSE